MTKRAPIRQLPSAEFLRSVLDYNPETGALVWRAKPATTKANKCFNTKYAGKPAGGLTVGRPDGSNRYIVVGMRCDGVYNQFQSHRIIWKMVTGEEPPDFLDHGDGDELNLKWENFRSATNGQNIQNSKLRKDNKSGVKGVCWDAYHAKWVAHIGINGKQTKLGRFNSIVEAAEIVNAARAKMHGEFSRFE